MLERAAAYALLKLEENSAIYNEKSEYMVSDFSVLAQYSTFSMRSSASKGLLK